MGLSCECAWDDGDGWYYNAPADFSLYDRARRKRCFSCQEFVAPGQDVVKFERSRSPQSDVEIRIYDEEGEVPMASWYMCERCGGLYFSLTELGFCVSLGSHSNHPDNDMRELVKEYALDYGPPRGNHEAN